MVGDGSEEAKEIGGRADGAAEEGGRGRANNAVNEEKKAVEPSKGANHLFHGDDSNGNTISGTMFRAEQRS